jgi:hypothetical protein
LQGYGIRTLGDQIWFGRNATSLGGTGRTSVVAPHIIRDASVEPQDSYVCIWIAIALFLHGTDQRKEIQWNGKAEFRTRMKS